MVAWEWGTEDYKDIHGNFGVMDIFCIVIVEMVSQVHTEVKSYLTVHFKHVQFIVYLSYTPKQPWAG